MNYDHKQFGFDKTPILETPFGFGRSMHVMNSPGPAMYSRGLAINSPIFTPVRSYHHQ